MLSSDVTANARFLEARHGRTPFIVVIFLIHVPPSTQRNKSRFENNAIKICWFRNNYGTIGFRNNAPT